MNKDNILLAHGSGGRLSRDFINDEITSRFGDGPLAGLPDGALLPAIDGDIIFSTDSFVVQPLEFPGGNIGDLAVHGTINDIAVSGGIPLWLSIGLIIEEGFPLEKLRLILDSLKKAADNCGVKVVTGDTKVVAKGQCDGIYINSAGLGRKIDAFSLDPNSIREGDCVISSGTIGDHGMAILSARKNINIQNGPVSDSGPVHRLVQAAEEFAGDVRFMRDPTRGGVAAVLNEIVEDKEYGIVISENSIPLSKSTHAVSEMLGIEALHMASEGRMLMICSPDVSEKIITRWEQSPEGAGACVIGKVTADSRRVIMETLTGGKRLVDVPRGELLPRIC